MQTLTERARRDTFDRYIFTAAVEVQEQKTHGSTQAEGHPLLSGSHRASHHDVGVLRLTF